MILQSCTNLLSVRGRHSTRTMSDKVRHACTAPQNRAADLEVDDLCWSYVDIQQHCKIDDVAWRALIDIMQYELP